MLAAGGSKTFRVDAEAGATWSASRPAQHTWLTSFAPTAGGGATSSATTVSYTLSANNSYELGRSTAIDVTRTNVAGHADHVIQQYPIGFPENDGIITQTPYDITGATATLTIDVGDFPANEELRNLYVQIGPDGSECFFGVQFGPRIIALYEVKWGNHLDGPIGTGPVLDSMLTRCSLDLSATTFSSSGTGAHLVTKLTRKSAMGTGALDVAVSAITEVNPTNATYEPRWHNFVTGFWTLTSGGGSTFQPTRLNVGGPRVQDSQGNWWETDTNTSGCGWTTGDAIGDAPNDQILYKDMRFMESTATCGGGPLTYRFPAPGGQSYAVTLKFAELSIEKAGERLFHVDINGQRVLTNFDVYSEAGGRRRAVDKTFAVALSAAQSEIKIDFTAVLHSATINAIEILQISTSGNPALTPATPTVNFGTTRQFAATNLNAGEQVSWEVVDPIEAGRSLGTVNASGLYTAPASATTPQAALVLAKVNSYPARKAYTKVTLAASGGGGGTFYSAVLPLGVAPAGTGRLKANLSGDSRFLRDQWRMEMRLHNYTFRADGTVLHANNHGAQFVLTGTTQYLFLGDGTNSCRFVITGKPDLVLRWQRNASGLRGFEMWQVNGGVVTALTAESCWMPQPTATTQDDFRVADFSIGSDRWATANSLIAGSVAYLRMYDTAVVAGTAPSLTVESGAVRLLDYEFDSTDPVLMLNDSAVPARNLTKDPAGMTVNAVVTP